MNRGSDNNILHCEQVEQFASFYDKLTRQRVPFGGQIATTYRCNLKCVHCYAVGLDSYEKGTSWWRNIIKQIADYGCLFLVMTGGEPLIREDFADIYSCAVEKGILVTVFSNLTILNKEHIALFKNYPPQEIETTLLGATEGIHDMLADTRGSFAKTMSNIENLLNNGIRVSIKTILMKGNINEIDDIQLIAKKLGVRFRLDGLIFAALDGDKKPLSYRINPPEIVKIEMKDKERYAEWKRYFEKYGSVNENEPLFRCAAAETCFYINPAGFLQPCVMVPNISISMAEGFSDAWDKLGKRVRRCKLPKSSPCRGCNLKGICGYCPGIFFLEGTTARVPPDFLCKLGKARYNYVVKGILK